MLYVFLAVLVVGILIFLAATYALFGKGPRLRRAFGRIERLLQEGNWSEALQRVAALQADNGLSADDKPPENTSTARWVETLRAVSGKAYQAAAESALKDKQFEEALDHAVRAAELLGAAQSDARVRVVEAMLAEVRRLFAAGNGDCALVFDLLVRIGRIAPSCPEASFWHGLCLVRQNHLEAALKILTSVHEQVGKNYIDPAFYTGGVLHRLGRHQEAVRLLSEANRVDPNCPFVTLQMGLALLAGSGDSGMAVRALQKAVGPRGLVLWERSPPRAWVEAFPEGRSFVRRLAAKYPYVCPLLGSDLVSILRQGNLALAQAHYRGGHFQEAADLYTRLMQDSPPTLPLLRGLGLSLARLQRYDQAFKHLRTALELDEGKDPLTAGYLALCGAMGKPTNPDDKPKNVTWSIRLISRYQLTGNAEWASIWSAIFAEARSLGMLLIEEDQVQLCNVLAAVNAIDEQAAAAYGHLAMTFPQSVVPRHAWLYCQAATVNGFKGPADVEMFARTFRDAQPARDFFARQQWNLDDVLYTYLARSARQAPGQFPDALGPGFAEQGERFLLERSKREEEAGRKDTALAAVDVLLHLAPRCLPVYDRLACLHYRKGDLEGAVTLLAGWRLLAPKDHWPLIREAIIEQERGNMERRAEAINQALGLTQGPVRAGVAFLGAKLALRQALSRSRESGVNKQEAVIADASELSPATNLLQECLRSDPDHVDALWCTAAIGSVLGDRERLKSLAVQMDRPAVKDARFHYLGAVCQLARRDYARALELSQRAAVDDSLAGESHYLMGWAHWHMGNPTAATQALLKAANADKSPSVHHARALLGRLSYERQAYDEAIRWWNLVDANKRAEWKLEEPLQQTVLLAGLKDFEKSRFEQAAERFREASKLGLAEKRLGSLLTLALVKAGQRLLFDVAEIGNQELGVRGREPGVGIQVSGS